MAARKWRGCSRIARWCGGIRVFPTPTIASPLPTHCHTSPARYKHIDLLPIPYPHMTDTLPTHYQPITHYQPTQSPTITDPLPNHYQPITDTLPTHYQPITHVTRETHTACCLQLALCHLPLLPHPPRNLRGWAAVPLSANRSTAKQKQKQPQSQIATAKTKANANYSLLCSTAIFSQSGASLSSSAFTFFPRP